jgi:hypothetical protein
MVKVKRWGGAKEVLLTIEERGLERGEREMDLRERERERDRERERWT